MLKLPNLCRIGLFAMLLSLLALFQAGPKLLYAQTSSQDLGFSDSSVFPETPTPNSFITISLTIANNGTLQSNGFNITTEFERVGVGAVALESNQLTNPCATSTFCNIGIPGRQPILDNNGQATGAFTEPSTRQVLLSLNTTDLDEGLYQMTVRLDATTFGNGTSTGITNDPIGSDQTLVIDLPIFSRPELSPSALTFLPGSPVPFGSQVRVSASVVNTGQREISGSAQVDFLYCQQLANEAPCEPSNNTAFGTTASRLLFMPTDFVASGASATAQTEATLDTSQLSRGLFRIGVRVTFNSADSSVFEADLNNNELNALLTIGASAGGGSTGGIQQLLVGENQVGAFESPVFVSTQGNRLIVFDRANLETLVTCGGLILLVCPSDLEGQSKAFVSPFPGTNADTGTVRLDVLGDAFSAFDESFTSREFIRADFTFSANITFLAENPTESIIYIGLANGKLIRLNLEQSLGTLSSTTAEDLEASGITIRADSELTAVLPLSNGVVVGATDITTGVGRVFFLLDDRTSASLISSVSNMGRVHKFEATPGFLYLATENTLGGAPLFFITRIRTDSIDTIFRSASLQGLNGSYADFVVNRSSRLFIATNSDQNATVFSYRLSPTQNTSSPLFDPWTSFTDPADNLTTFNLTPVQTLALGDVTPNTNGDEVIYIGTNDRLYTVETQRQFSSSGDLLWIINVAGNVSSFEVDRLGTIDTGFSLLSTGDSTFNFVDGRNRSPTNQAPNLTVSVGETVNSTIFTEDASFGDFVFTKRILSLFGSDALYFNAVIP